MGKPLDVVALSGGKDSTAMALRLAEVEPDVRRVYLCTPTGDELPEMVAHWAKLEDLLGQPIERVSSGTLESWTDQWSALPNSRMRWCTRVLKIEPALAYLAKLPAGSRMCVGLRADEETREGIYSETIVSRFPLREWGWGIGEVRAYLSERGVSIPRRTDCARCYGQRIGEWWELWKTQPEIWGDCERQEAATGHTYRSATRDTWPAQLVQLRKKFEGGARPALAGQLTLDDVDADAYSGCRICRL